MQIENLESHIKMVTIVVRRVMFDFGVDTSGSVSVSEDDLVGEGMVALIRAWRTYDASRGASFETFASRVIRNHVIDILRKRNTKTNNIGVSAEETVTGETLETTIERMEYMQVLGEILKNVTEIERAIFNAYLRGYTYKEIAEVFEISNKKIDNTIQKIKKLVITR